MGEQASITALLNRVQHDGATATSDLLDEVYRELHQLASSRMRGQPVDHTLSPTGLLHESFIKLLPQIRDRDWVHRGQFYAAASQAMRSVLVDYARKKKAKKRTPPEYSTGRLHGVKDFFVHAQPDVILALDEALRRLETEDAALCNFIELRFFTGLSVQDAAEIMGWSSRTAARRWSFARAWLYKQISD